MPAGPGAPVGPAGPAGPTPPAAPAGPGGPAGPGAPVSPRGPAAPGAPAGPCGPCGPSKHPASSKLTANVAKTIGKRIACPPVYLMKRSSRFAEYRAAAEVNTNSFWWRLPGNDHMTNCSRGASAPELCGVRSLSLPPTTRGSGAPRGASNQCPRNTCRCCHRPMRSGADARRRQVYASLLYAVRAPHLLSGALASRRSAAALATPVATSIGSAPGRVSWDPALAGVTRLRLSQSSALRADRSFCRTNGVQGRPGAGLRIPPAGAALAPASVRHRRRPSNERDGLAYN